MLTLLVSLVVSRSLASHTQVTLMAARSTSEEWYYSDLTVSAAAHGYARLNVLNQILASQIASVVELGNRGQII